MIAAFIRTLTPWDLGVDTMYDALNPAGDGTLPADGASMTNVADRGKRGNTQTQGNGSLQITWVKNAVNNLPAFNFSGSQWMSATDSVNNQATGPITVLTAFMTTSVAGVTQRLLTKLLTWSWSLSFDNYSFTTWLSSTGFSALSTTSPVTANVWQRGDFLWNGSSVDFYKNSALNQNVALSNANSVSTNPLYFGTRDGSQGFVTGRCALQMVFFKALATWQRMHIQLYMKSRIGV